MPAKRSKPAREHVIPVTVEFEDVDSYRIAHHTKLIAYLERARVRFFGQLGLDLHQGFVSRAHAAPVVARMETRFRRPALFSDRLQVAVFVREVTDYTLVLGYRIRRQGETLASATTTLAFTQLQEQSIMPIPDDFLAALEVWQRGTPGDDPGAGPG